MNAIRVVVADTTPLNYLILIGHVEILASLFGEVLIPHAVLEELSHAEAPEAISRWLLETPVWLRISPVEHLDETIQLGRGESEAISLAIERRVKVVLIDERLGRGAAEARGLIPVGTLTLIDLADERGLLDGIAALNDLRQTTFRASPELLGRFEARMRARHD
jgi:predicted nucleic acid-binding protein